VSHGRDIVVVGASAGGIQALLEVVRGLPAEFPAAIFVVVHTSPDVPSVLPRIIQRAGQLPAHHARDGAPITVGRIYVAPPDRHLLVREGYVELTRGPRENHSRPAVDPLFRSASRAYGHRVMGVVLSGALGDGAAGLLAVKSRGGAAIVQDPDEAIIEGMPRSALRLVDVDCVLPAAMIAQALVQLAREPVAAAGAPAMGNGERAIQTIREDLEAQARDERDNELTLFTCPDCGGSLWQVDEGPLLRFQCHVGHAFGPEALISLKSEELEAALWTCVRLLTEKATLTRQLANRTLARGNGNRETRIREQAELDERHAAIVREFLESMTTPVASAALVSAAMSESNDDYPS
jgi:two-component system chemotaxis response regulator CheB